MTRDPGPPQGGPGRVRDQVERVLAGAYECVGRVGLSKTTIDDVARASGLSRATIYRLFPGGRDQVLRETVGWEMDHFFIRLAAEIEDAPDFPSRLERGLAFARRAVLEHELLQTVLASEPEVLLPLMTVEQHRILGFITSYFRPLLEAEDAAGNLVPSVDIDGAADHIARLVLSLIGSPARWDLSDPDAVHRLVRDELLAGIVSVRTR